MKKKKELLQQLPSLAYRYRWEFARMDARYRKDWLRYKEAWDKYVKSLPEIRKKKAILRFKKEYRKLKKLKEGMLRKYGFCADCSNSYEDFALLKKKAEKKPKKYYTKHNSDINFRREIEEADAILGKYMPIVKVHAASVQGITKKNIKYKSIDYDPDFPDTEMIDFIKKQNKVKTISNIRTLKLSLNLLCPKERLLEEIRIIIDYYRKLIGNPHRLQLENYEEYLRIYRLKTEGKKNIQIAYILFPRHTQQGQPSILQRVTRGYKKARQLVNGGWRRIT